MHVVDWMPLESGVFGHEQSESFLHGFGLGGVLGRGTDEKKEQHLHLSAGCTVRLASLFHKTITGVRLDLWKGF